MSATLIRKICDTLYLVLETLYCILVFLQLLIISFIVSQQHLTDMKATQTMSNDKLFAKGKAVTFEPDMYYSRVNIGV